MVNPTLSVYTSSKVFGLCHSKSHPYWASVELHSPKCVISYAIMTQDPGNQKINTTFPIRRVQRKGFSSYFKQWFTLNWNHFSLTYIISFISVWRWSVFFSRGSVPLRNICFILEEPDTSPDPKTSLVHIWYQCCFCYRSYPSIIIQDTFRKAYKWMLPNNEIFIFLQYVEWWREDAFHCQISSV